MTWFRAEGDVLDGAVLDFGCGWSDGREVLFVDNDTYWATENYLEIEFFNIKRSGDRY